MATNKALAEDIKRVTPVESEGTDPILVDIISTMDLPNSETPDVNTREPQLAHNPPAPIT